MLQSKKAIMPRFLRSGDVAADADQMCMSNEVDEMNFTM